MQEIKITAKKKNYVLMKLPSTQNDEANKSQYC